MKKEEVPNWMKEEGVEELPEDILDLEIEMEAVEKQRQYRVLPRLEIPGPDKPSIEVEIAGEPYKVENPKMRTGFGYFLNVIDKKDGMLKQITYPKTLAQAMLANDIYKIIDGKIVRDGQRLRIGKQRMPTGYRTKTGELVEEGASIVVEKIGEREAEVKPKERLEEKSEDKILSVITKLGSVRVSYNDIVNTLIGQEPALVRNLNKHLESLRNEGKIVEIGEDKYSVV